MPEEVIAHKYNYSKEKGFWLNKQFEEAELMHLQKKIDSLEIDQARLIEENISLSLKLNELETGIVELASMFSEGGI